MSIPRGLKTTAGIGCGLVLLVIIIGAVYIVRVATAGRRVEKEVARLEAAGDPVSMADIYSTDIPPDRNAALVYDKIFRRFSGPQWMRDAEVLRDFSSKSKRDSEPSLWASSRDVYARYKDVLPLVDKALAKQECRFAVNWQDGPMEIKYRYLANFRHLSRLLMTAAILEARDGHTEVSLSLIKSDYGLCQSLKDGPTLVHPITGLACIALSEAAFADIAACSRLTEAQARRIYDDLEEIDLSEAFLHPLHGERAAAIEFFALMRKDPLNMGKIRRTPMPKAGKPSFFWRLRSDVDEEFYLKTMQKYIDASGMPYRESGRDLALRKSDVPFGAILAFILLPSADICYRKRDEGIAHVQGTQVFAALLAYKDRYGDYPASLRDLSQKLGWAIQEDPFSGNDFIYERRGRGFVLYSIGPNLRDDGGINLQELRQKREGKTEDRDGYSDAYDIVWKLDK